jgi:hypothetical protein
MQNRNLIALLVPALKGPVPASTPTPRGSHGLPWILATTSSGLPADRGDEGEGGGA